MALCNVLDYCRQFRRGPKIIFVSVASIILLEVALRVTNGVYPLEKPEHLKDTYRTKWLEGTDRLDGRTRLYVYEPNSVGKTYGHEFRVNRWGFRGGDFGTPSSETFRIMVLGDSITSGIGIAEKDRYTNVLERRLRQLYANRSIEVINLGVAGFETVQQEKIMRRMWDVVHPHLTIVGFDVNDPQVTYNFYLPYRLPIAQAARSMAWRSLTFRLLEAAYDPIYRKLNNVPSREAMMWLAYEPETEDWKLFERSVESIGRWVIERTRQSPIAMFLSDFRNLPRVRKAAEQVSEVFVRNGFLWCDPEGNRYAPVSRFETHANEDTHRWYADAILKTIIDKRLLAQSGDKIPHDVLSFPH